MHALSLRNANVGCTPQHVSVALSSIVWSAGNVPTPPIVEKCIAIWNRMGQDEAVNAIFLLAQAYYGRDSRFDEYSEVTLMINACKSNADLAWCAETMVFERALGVIAAILQPAIDLLESLKAGKPHILPKLSAEDVEEQFSTAQRY